MVPPYEDCKRQVIEEWNNRSGLQLSSPRQFTRELTLFDEPGTRKKAAVMDNWDVMIDDGRNPDFEGLDDFLQWGKRYRITLEEVPRA
jgi:hypothetical protein